MSDLEPKDANEYCNARKTDGSGYCKHTAGWGTDHTGHGRCRYHGGNVPNQEKGIIDDLEGAAEHAATALELQLKHLRRDLEDGEEIDPADLDRLATTVLDRTGHGKTEKQEVEHSSGEGEELPGVNIYLDDEYVDD